MELYSIRTDGQLEPWNRREWLLTNGIGGFAGSTVVGCNTRRYHGLLCAATLPPVGRVMMLNRLGEIVLLDGKAEPMHEFSVNDFKGRFHPRGDRYLRQFALDDAARWEYDVDGVRIVKEVQMLWKRNVTGIRYTVDAGRARQVQLQLLPFVSMRDYHAVRRVGDSPNFQVSIDERRMAVSEGKWALRLLADQGRFVHQPDWWRGHFYAIEAERGLDDMEDLFTPGRLVLDMPEGKGTVTIWAAGAEDVQVYDWDGELARRREAMASVCRVPEGVQPTGKPAAATCDSPSITIRRLVRAANDFIVYRKSPTGQDGTTIIAGYPWFADWGRDTMISLPGLLLTTGRLEQTRQVLSVYANYVSEGMIPNRFDDYDNKPHYNTVDASLWFIHAVYEYLGVSGDQQTFDRLLLPACRQIIQGYRRGTRYGIGMDQRDGLMNQGDAGTQLTWMDAKCDGVVFTPRHGKAVEINALWYHALVLTGETDLAAKVAESFRKSFWISPFRGLADVVHPDGKQDRALRPNQIFAVSLPNSPLSDDQQFSVVDAVRRELLTPKGLRSLAPGEIGYVPRLIGPPRQRDAAYHNGTVWAWLIGPFLDAHLRVHKQSEQSRLQARLWLQPLIEEMALSCIGQIAEVFDADEPHRAAGCPAQAWSVAEVLRLAVKLGM